MVMPWRRPWACCGSVSRAASEWTWVSMKPGETVSPDPSIVRPPSAAERSPTASMRSPRYSDVGGSAGTAGTVYDCAAANYYVERHDSSCMRVIRPSQNALG